MQLTLDLRKSIVPFLNRELFNLGKIFCSESKNQSSEKNALCRWICNLKSFLNREFTDYFTQFIRNCAVWQFWEIFYQENILHAKQFQKKNDLSKTSNMDRQLLLQRLVKKYLQWKHCCLQDKMRIKMPKQTIVLETPVFLFSLLRFVDELCNEIIGNPYLRL